MQCKTAYTTICIQLHVRLTVPYVITKSDSLPCPYQVPVAMMFCILGLQVHVYAVVPGMFLVTPVILHHEPNPQSSDEAVCQDYDTARFGVILSPSVKILSCNK